MNASGYTVSGPGIDRRSPEPGPALSLAITLASKLHVAGSVYVRDNAGTFVGRAERDDLGNIAVYTAKGAK